MLQMIFVLDEQADGRNQKFIGIHSEDGRWQGHRIVEMDVRKELQLGNLDLSVEADRIELRKKFSGSRMFAMEASDWNGEVVLMI